MPLREGERPVAVTVAAVLAFVAGLAAVLPYVLGSQGVAGASLTSALPLAALLLVSAIGMWFGQYWAVLGFQAYLVLVILVLSLFLIRAENWWSALVAAAFMGAAGTMFWYLVKAMARIQMPGRQPPEREP